MQLIVHKPSTQEGMQELSHRASALYAEAIVQCLQSHSCPYHQKLQLMETLISHFKDL